MKNKLLIFTVLSILLLTSVQMFAQETFKDRRDGNVYTTIKIGNQVWMPMMEIMLRSDEVYLSILEPKRLYLLIPESEYAQKELEFNVKNEMYNNKSVISEYLFRYENSKWVKTDKTIHFK